MKRMAMYQHGFWAFFHPDESAALRESWGFSEEEWDKLTFMMDINGQVVEKEEASHE